MRPVLGGHRLVGKSSRGSRQPGGRLKLHVAFLLAVGRVTCGFTERPVTALVRCCSRFTDRQRTQHGPTRGRACLLTDVWRPAAPQAEIERPGVYKAMAASTAAIPSSECPSVLGLQVLHFLDLGRIKICDLLALLPVELFLLLSLPICKSNERGSLLFA
jgi:hypothetical protein